MAGRVAPDLGGQRIERQQGGIRGIAGRIGQRGRPGHAAAGLAVVEELTRNIDESALTQTEADVGGNLITLAVAVAVILAVTTLDFDALIPAYAIVHHAGDGV